VQHKATVEVQERAVRLTSGVGDLLGGYEGVISQAGTNLQNLAGEAQVALPALLRVLGSDLSGAATGLPTGANLQTSISTAAVLESSGLLHTDKWQTTAEELVDSLLAMVVETRPQAGS
jgi:hypothetical protein